MKVLSHPGHGHDSLNVHTNHPEDHSAVVVLTLSYTQFILGFVCRADFISFLFYPPLCFILQLHINYAGEHQSQPIHGYQTESYVSEGEDCLCPTHMLTHRQRFNNI